MTSRFEKDPVRVMHDPTVPFTRLKPRPVPTGQERQFIHNFYAQTFMREEDKERVKTQDFWKELRERTIARYKLRNPDSTFDIETTVDLVHAEVIQREGIRIKKDYSGYYDGCTKMPRD